MQIGGYIEGMQPLTETGYTARLAADGIRLFVSSIIANGSDGTLQAGAVSVFNLVDGDWVRVSPGNEGEVAADRNESMDISRDSARKIVGSIKHEPPPSRLWICPRVGLDGDSRRALSGSEQNHTLNLP